jgi:CubicO group peptidase (beta-lactamase class C family)
LAFCLSSKEQSKEVDELMKPYVSTNNFSGSILIARNGNILLSKAYGPMNRSYNAPNTTQTKFYLASVSMIFTSAAIMKLVEEGKISLEDPLSKYLPNYKQAGRLTIQHLLSQRSGIPAIGDNKKVNYDSITKFPQSIEHLINFIVDDTLLFVPGSKYNHGRSDYIILAYIIEKVSGMPFGKYLSETIFKPLGMSGTGHSNGESEIVNNLAVGYAPLGNFDVENAYQIDWTSKTGHGSIYSTAEDMNKIAAAILNNSLLTKNSWQKIFEDYGNNVGYAWFIRGHLDKKRYQMNGRSPGFSSYIGIYPDDKLTVIVLSNNYISLPPDIGKQLAAIAFKAPYAKPNITVTKLTPEQGKSLAGKYRFDDKFYFKNFEMDVSYKDGNLSCTWGALIPTLENGVLSNKFIQRDYWSEVEFTKNSKGEIEAMMYDGFKGVKLKDQ